MPSDVFLAEVFGKRFDNFWDKIKFLKKSVSEALRLLFKALNFKKTGEKRP